MEPARNAPEPTDPLTIVPGPPRGHDLNGTLDLSFLGPAHDGTYLGTIDTYRVLGVLGTGGMGVVLEAYDPALERIVAIKVLAAHLAADEAARQRLVREARAAAAIRHPNVVVIHAIGECGGTPYIAMEHVEGESLKALIESGKGFSNRELVRVGAQVAAGLDAAHRVGIVHRDVKPANILIEAETGLVKVADFGLARPERPDRELTTQWRLVGTPLYMSPEQVRGQALDGRSDLFSLGDVLYAMASGAAPFHGAHPLDTIRRIEAETPPRLRDVAPGIHPDLSDLVARLLEKEPARRCQSAAEVRASLERIPLTAADDAPLTARRAATSVRFGGRRLWRPLAVVAAALAVAACGWLWWPDLMDERVGTATGGAARDRDPERDFTVSQTGEADYGSLRQALRAAGPGTTIHILDGGTYEGPFEVTAFGPHKYVTVQGDGPEPPMLVAEGETVVLIEGPSGVTLRNLRIHPAPQQAGLIVRGGGVRDLTLERLHCQQPEQDGPPPALVKLERGAAGIAGQPIRITDSVFDCAKKGLGIFVEGSEQQPAAWVEIRGNRFSGSAVQLLVWGPMTDVRVEGNIFIRASDSLNLNFEQTASARRVAIVNNTFFEPVHWLGLVNTVALQEVTVRNNLIVRARAIGLITQDLRAFASGWRPTHNLWQPMPQATWDPLHEGLFAERRDDLRLLSEDPSDPEFVRPAADSPAAAGGAGGDLPDYVGARAPQAAGP